VIKNGSYFRRDDSRFIARFKCTHCLKQFSLSTKTLEWKQKKRRINHQLFKLLASGISMRRSALILNVNRTTIDRKFIYLAEKAKQSNQDFLQQLKNYPISHLQIDDLITIEHTKLKPLSVSIAINVQTRHILGIEVGRIPAFGHLSRPSKIKYGKRKSEHLEILDRLFSKIKTLINPYALIESDEHKFYPIVISKYFPLATHHRYPGGRSSIVGQGELKKLHYDPLFKINHTCAMLRANINRLFRKTWCTTKDPGMLQKHLEIYIQFHNQILIK
jgi:hypothetical protein